MKKLIKAGSTDQTIDVFIQDSSSTVGAGLTGLVYNTASLVCYYRKGATGSATALTLATQTVGGAHSDGGFVEISSANMPGMYRLDLSDTIVATAGTVTLMLKGAANMAQLPIELQVVSFNPEDAVRLGLTALPNAAADAPGGLIISDAGGLDADAQRSDVAAILVDTGTTLDGRIPAALVSGRMDSSTGAMAANVITATSIAADAITAAKIADGAIDAATFAAGAINAAAIAADAITDAKVASDVTIASVTGSVGSVAGQTLANLDAAVSTRLAAGSYTAPDNASIAAILADTGTDGVAISNATILAIADALLNRDMSAVSDTNARSPLNALRTLRNKFSISGGVITFTKEDDATTAFTSTLTSDAAAEPVIGSDPA